MLDRDQSATPKTRILIKLGLSENSEFETRRETESGDRMTSRCETEGSGHYFIKALHVRLSRGSGVISILEN